jgi:hypothetical protein
MSVTLIWIYVFAQSFRINVCVLLRTDHDRLLTKSFQFMYMYLTNNLAQYSYKFFSLLVSSPQPGHRQTYIVSRGLPVDTV